MSGITTGVGIFSGIDSASLIDQLLAIEARPKTLAQRRIVALQTQQAAILDVNSALLSLKSAAGAFRTNKTFRSAKAVSSNPDVLTATATFAASPGTYNFRVSRLVSTDQQLSRGFADRDVSGVGASQFTFELGGGRLDSETKLASLNGGSGVARGKIRVTDASGGTAVVDLSTAVTVDDVLDAINSASGVSVVASVDSADGDRLRIEDTSGGGGTFTIENAFGSTTATSLGIAGSGAGGVITGSSINRLSGGTALSVLNDGSGVTIRNSAAFDLRITARDGSTHEIKLGEILDTEGEVVQTRAATLQQVIDRINQVSPTKIRASIASDGVSLQIEDLTGASASDLIVEDGQTARDLGIVGQVAGTAISGERIIAGINSTLASSLNGGQGISSGTIQFTRRDGVGFTVDVDDNASISDIIAQINDAGGGVVTASLNSAGNGLRITDASVGGNDFRIVDFIGSAAQSLGIDTAGEADGVVESGNLQTRYVSGATLLENLNAGRGVGVGQFRITDSTGATSVVDVTSSVRTVDDLVTLINSRPTNIVARVNDNGDGVLLEDTSNGGQAIRVENVSGTVATALRIEGTSEGSGLSDNRLDGSYETVVEFDSTDTLDEIVQKINDIGTDVLASVVNDGSTGTPYRLAFNSRVSGAIGRLTIDTGGLDLSLTSLTRGEDAVVFYGSADPAQALLLTSDTNTLDNVLAGVSIDLASASSENVELVVSRDTASIETGIKSFIDAFNAVLTRIDKYDAYDADTNVRGPLLGDATVQGVRSNLLRIVQGRPFNVSGRYDNLVQVGVTVGEGGNLKFDAARFRQAFETDPAAVEALFADFEQAPNDPEEILNEDGDVVATTPRTEPEYLKLGVAELIKNLSEALSNSVDGVVTRRSKTIDSQIDLQKDRIATFDVQLERKRARLQAQFIAMERAIGALQQQQGALGSLQG